VKPQRVQSGGFTLIEIMMVVVILGMTLSMGLPAFYRAMKKEGMRKAESELVEACQTARRQAIMSGNETKLIFHPLDGTFEVPGAYERKEIPVDIIIDILGVNFIQYEKAPEAEVDFFRNGTSDEFTIVLRGADGTARKISLDSVTALPFVENLR
jgi:prepilin-type N-terminal cleavage/methylation domain-containing protein